MSNTCKGCKISNLKDSKDRGCFYKVAILHHNECPCSICLIKVICMYKCEEFSTFLKNKDINRLETFKRVWSIR